MREDNGTYPKNTWRQISGKWYWFDARGYMVTGWKSIGGKWYYFQSNGAMLGQGWHWIGKNCYYMYASGAMAANTWIGKDYVNASGAWVKGMVKEQPRWIKAGERWWYRHADGSYTKGNWEKINGQWYLFDKEGWMLTGWQEKSGKWYYLKQDGAMASDTWIDHKYVNASGDLEENHIHPHEYDKIVLKEATCDETGKKRVTCRLCGEEKIEEIPALQHDYIWKSNGDETMSYVCTRCGDVSKSAKCNYIQSNVVESTCSQQGYKEFTCEECGDVKKELLDKVPHDYVVTKVEGKYRYSTCRNCGNNRLEVFPEDIEPDTSTPGENDKVYTITLKDGETTTVTGHFETEMADEVFEMLNDYREENGLQRLEKGSQPLEEAANTRAVEITYLFDHKRPNGENALRSLTGSTGCMAENIGKYQSSAEQVMESWKNSAGHNSNMLTKYAKFVSIGVFAKYEKTVDGKQVYSNHFVQLFGWDILEPSE